MRIVAGKHAGRHLTSPAKRIRPTAETVRDRWLGRLKDDLDGARVLDLFAGSGALGLEALSRGAASADFVENAPEALHSLKANVAALREKKRTRIFKRDAIVFAEALDEHSYDIAFVGRALRVEEAGPHRPHLGLLSFRPDSRRGART